MNATGMASIFGLGLALFMLSFFGSSYLFSSSHHSINTLASSSQAIQMSLSQSVSGGGLTVTLSGTITDPNQGAQISYGSVSVNWGDGASTQGLYPVHTYSRSGSYTITTTVRDSLGITGTNTKTVNLAAGGGGTTVSTSFPGITDPSTGLTSPTLNFNPQVGGNGMFVTVSGSIVDPNRGASIRSVTWDWGDGSQDTTGFSPQHSYTIPGQYSISGTVIDSYGEASSQVESVSVSQGAGATIQIITTNNQGQNNLPISMSVTATSSGLTVTPHGTINDPNPAATTISVSWDWGDGTAPSTGWSSGLSHTYAQSGTYVITVTATDDIGLRNSQSITTSVGGGSSTSSGSSGGIQIQFNLVKNGGLKVTPQGSATDTAQASVFSSVIWDWGDGTPDTHGWPSGLSHTYAQGGTYTVTFSVSDNFGQSASATQTVSLQSALSQIGFNVNYKSSGLTVTPSGSINDPNDAAKTISVSWDWGDGSSPSGGWPSGLSHTYASAGQYAVTITATDDIGQSNTNVQLVTVSGTSGGATSGGVSGKPISISVSYPKSGLKVTPSGSINDPNDAATSISTNWDWGDGTSPSTGWPSGLSHTYSQGGTYVITLTATDNIGTTNTQTASVSVNPSATTTIQQSSVVSGQPIAINVNYQKSGETVVPQGSINDPNTLATSLNVLWSWGDGTTSGAWPSGLSHTYITPGSYTITVTTRDNLGLTNTASQTVNVQ